MPSGRCEGGPLAGKSYSYGGYCFEVREPLPSFELHPEPIPIDLSIRTLGGYYWNGKSWDWKAYD